MKNFAAGLVGQEPRVTWPPLCYWCKWIVFNNLATFLKQYIELRPWQSACISHGVCFLRSLDLSICGLALRKHSRATGLVLTQPEKQLQRQSRRAVM